MMQQNNIHPSSQNTIDLAHLAPRFPGEERATSSKILIIAYFRTMPFEPTMS
jgi:hypothetical protein